MQKKKSRTDDSDSKKFWSCIKSPKTGQSKSNDASYIPSTEWFTYFKYLFVDTHDDNEMQQRAIFENLNEQRESDLLDAEISEEEITYSLQSLRNN